MGFFSKSSEANLCTCKLCDKSVDESNYVSDHGICFGCALVLESTVKSSKNAIADLQEKANSATSPGEKIAYLSVMLDVLYEYKIRYYDNDVDVLEQDVTELIADVIDCISEARI